MTAWPGAQGTRQHTGPMPGPTPSWWPQLPQAPGPQWAEQRWLLVHFTANSRGATLWSTCGRSGCAGTGQRRTDNKQRPSSGSTWPAGRQTSTDKQKHQRMVNVEEMHGARGGHGMRLGQRASLRKESFSRDLKGGCESGDMGWGGRQGQGAATTESPRQHRARQAEALNPRRAGCG